MAIGSAWTTKALVNAETILWAETAVDRGLAPATVVGQPVDLRVHFDRATWVYGDGTTRTTTRPGTAYTDADPCNTAQCAHYDGHTYVARGPVTITLTVSWDAQYSLDAGATWTDLDTPITGPATTHDLTVVQARGVLVKDPGP